MQGFMSQWSLITLLSVNTTLEYLGYFGYPFTEHESQSYAIAGKLSTHDLHTLFVCFPSIL
jgi:hypothetical protein